MKNPLLNSKAAESLKQIFLKAMYEMPLPAFVEFVRKYCSDNLGSEDIKSIVSDLKFIIENKEN